MTLATLAQLKTQLNFKQSDTQYDAKLTLFLSAASDWIESYCNRKFESQVWTELFHGNRSNLLNPKQWPITAITSLKISGTRDWSDPGVLVDAADYGIDSDEVGVIYFGAHFPGGFNNVQLVYTAGYATIPSDLQLVCLWAGEWFYLHNQRGDAGRVSVGKQGESVGILADIPAMIKSVLQSYKRIELPTSGLAVSHI
jgi:hypothetical protein